MKRIAAIAALLALLGGAPHALAQFDYRTAGTYTTSVLQLRGSGTAPTLSPLGGGKIYFDTVCNCFKVSANGGAFEGLLLASTDAPVQSVFGRTGNVSPLQADYDAFFTTTAEAAAAAPVQSVFGRTGAVVAAQADYDGFFLTEAEADALYHPLQASVVNSFNGRTGAVSPAQADYDGWFLTPAEGDAAYARLATANTFSGAITTTGASSGIFSRGTSGSFANFFPWVSGDAGTTMFVGSATAGNNRVAIQAISDSATAINARSATGAAGLFESTGASAVAVLDINTGASHTGNLIRARFNSLTTFAVNKDGHVGITTTAHSVIPFQLIKAGNGSNALMYARGSTATDRAILYLDAGDGTTSTRQSYLQVATNEASGQSWRIGMNGTKSFTVQDPAAPRYVFEATDGANPRIGLRGLASASYGLNVPWLSGDVVPTMFVGSADVNNNQIALSVRSYSNRAAEFTSTTGSQVVYINGASGFTGSLIRADLNSAQKFVVNADGHIGIAGAASATVPLQLIKNGVGSTFLANFRGSAATDHGVIVVASGDNTTSTRFAYMRFSSVETSGQTWDLGMRGTKAFELRDSTGARTAVSVSDTTGVVDFPQGLSAGAGAAVTKTITATATWDPPSLANGGFAVNNMTVSGAVVGDICMVSFTNSLATGNFLSCFVEAANAVRVVLHNETGGGFDLASGTVRVALLRF